MIKARDSGRGLYAIELINQVRILTNLIII